MGCRKATVAGDLARKRTGCVLGKSIANSVAARLVCRFFTLFGHANAHRTEAESQPRAAVTGRPDARGQFDWRPFFCCWGWRCIYDRTLFDLVQPCARRSHRNKCGKRISDCGSRHAGLHLQRLASSTAARTWLCLPARTADHRACQHAYRTARRRAGASIANQAS